MKSHSVRLAVILLSSFSTVTLIIVIWKQSTWGYTSRGNIEQFCH